MRNKLVLFYACLLVISVFGGLYVVWASEYYEQSEYEENHPRLPIQNISVVDAHQYFSIRPIEYNNVSYFLKVHDESSRVILIRANNGSDYTNSTVEINMSYIKEVRHENNTMIIIIRKE